MVRIFIVYAVFIKFSSNIGTLGKISIFIKSKEEIEAEKYLNEIQEYEE
jgi:hypothetical protein